MEQADEESYPIGLNPRGLEVLEMIAPELLEYFNQYGTVKGWQITTSSLRRIAFTPSGLTVGTTRGRVVTLLLREALKQQDRIRLYYEHKLKNVNFEEKFLLFDTPNGEVTINASNDRVLVCDGVWSVARRAAESQYQDFIVKTVKWQFDFRLLLSSQNPETILDPAIHYIFVPRGVYAAILKDTRWVVALQIKQHDQDAHILQSREASAENIAYLKQWLKKHAAPCASMIPDEDYAEFFKRRTFSGAVVRLPRLNIGEWMLFLGDSAHSVLPPTGEGMNSALEDCKVLLQCLKDSPTNWFSVYNQQRLPDVTALGEYAEYLVRSYHDTPCHTKVVRGLSNAFLLLGQSCGCIKDTWASKTFGTKSQAKEPYAVISKMWKRQMAVAVPMAHICAALCYLLPIVILLVVILRLVLH